MSSGGLTEAAAEAVQTTSTEVLLRLAAGLESGEITLDATARTLQARLGVSSGRLGPIRRLLRTARDPALVAIIVRVAVVTADRVRADAPTVEIAATQPQGGGHIRTTGGVARDVVSGAVERLLVVGYSVTADPALAGLAAKTLTSMAAAASRGVTVTAILHRDKPNRTAMLRAWPRTAPQPRFYTWPEQENDAMAKMHAKVLVADARDALVTSANLTYHGFVGNVEMGVRIIGKPAKTVAEVFDRLLLAGEFVDWNP